MAFKCKLPCFGKPEPSEIFIRGGSAKIQRGMLEAMEVERGQMGAKGPKTSSYMDEECIQVFKFGTGSAQPRLS